MNKHSDFNRRAFWLWTLPVTLAFAGLLSWPHDAPDYTSAAAQQAAQEQAQALRKEKAEVAINQSEKQK